MNKETMEALKEITNWDCANHTYLVEGTKLYAYIPEGKSKPVVFKNPMRDFSKSKRKFITLRGNKNPFAPISDTNVIEVKGSRGNIYRVNVDEKTCSCPGYTFRGTCKHVNNLDK